MRLSDWLRQHPGVKLISRDRSSEYARGASEGAPEAQQIVDRWHVLKNLGEVLLRVLFPNGLRTSDGKGNLAPISPT